jgi:hypothetical protein
MKFLLINKYNERTNLIYQLIIFFAFEMKKKLLYLIIWKYFIIVILIYIKLRLQYNKYLKFNAITNAFIKIYNWAIN